MVFRTGDEVWTAFWKPQGEWCKVLSVHRDADFMSGRGIEVSVNGRAREFIDQNWFHRSAHLPNPFPRVQEVYDPYGWRAAAPSPSLGTFPATSQKRTTSRPKTQPLSPATLGDQARTKNSSGDRLPQRAAEEIASARHVSTC